MSTLYILYGSATGNAEGIAKDLAEKQPPNHFSSVVCKPMGDFKKLLPDWEQPPEQGRKHGVIFVCSTTGNGDPPENASRFVRFLKRKQNVETQPFQNVTFSVLGLGDTNYDLFCNTGKMVDKKMKELGGERAKPLVCADEATGLEEVVEPWLETIHQDMLVACRGGMEIPPETVQEETKAEVIDDAVTPVENVPLRTKSDSPLYVMYASATGNAEQIAKDLAGTYESLLGNPDAHTFFPSVVCCELNQFKKHLPTLEKENAEGGKHALIVVASTTGNADVPENAGRFTRFLKRKQTVETQPFRNVNFAVLGLGDTNYDVFCATGKEIDKRLALVGGYRAKPLACADEGTGLEDTVDPWTSSVLTDITNACRGGAATSGSTMPQKVEAISQPPNEAEEEKKSESADVAMEMPVVISDSSGVTSIKALLDLDSASPVPTVPPTMLPSLGASRSSCELFDENYQLSNDTMANFTETATISTESSGAALYTLSRPYESTIVGARYLTKTSADAAARVAENAGTNGLATDTDFLMARKTFESAFTLDGPSAAEAERNGKRVIELSLSLPDDFSLEYQPGDTIGLMVPNDPESVTFVLQMLQENHNVQKSQLVSIDKNRPITVEEAIREHIDLSCTVRNKKILNGLAQFATNENDAAALQLMASKDDAGSKLFQEFVVDQRRSFTDILRDFPSCQTIPIGGILSLLPAIPPRYYSISSSPLDTTKQNCLTIAFSVVDYLTPSLTLNGEEKGRRRMHGLATSYLEAASAPFLATSHNDAKSAPALKIFPKPTADFRPPSSLSTPMVLVGPGTGIAPFMGFLAHRKALLSSKNSTEAASSVVEGTWRGGYELEHDELPLGDKDAKGLVPAADFRSQEVVGNVEVYFGCRYTDHDWLFEQEMKDCVEEGVVSELNTAFSRGGSKQYVQDLMKRPEASQRLVKLLMEDNGRIYICGDGNSMAQGVQNALAEILGKNADGEVDMLAGKSHIDALKKEGRFLLDIWS